MGIVGTVLEFVLALPLYAWAFVMSGWTSLSLLYDFLYLVAKAETKSGSSGTGWNWQLSFEKILASYPYYLVVAGAVLMHYLVHSLLAQLRFSRRPDRVVWASLSAGVAIGWMYIFKDTLPFGRIGVYALTGDAQRMLVTMHSQSLVKFLLPYYMYVVLTGVTSSNRPGGFFVRKFIPTFAVIVYSVSTTVPAGTATSTQLLPSSLLRLTGWLLRVLAADAITETVIAWNERLTAVCLIVWTAAIGSAFNEYALYLNDALGLFPCLVLAGMAFWAHLAQIKAERR